MRNPFPKTPGIYIILNTSNTHCYIGSTRNLYERRRSHFKALKACKHYNAHLQNAYTLYGPDAFTFDVIEHLQNESDLLQREQYYIDLVQPEYNIAAYAGRPFAGVKRSPEFVARLNAAAAAANKQREYPKLTPEIVAKRSATVRAKHQAGEWVPHNKGKKATPEHCAKIAAAGRGRKLSPESAAKRSATYQANRAAGLHTMKGHEWSAESRAKVGASHRGRKQSPEHIAKVQATRKANRLAKQQAQE